MRQLDGGPILGIANTESSNCYAVNIAIMFQLSFDRAVSHLGAGPFRVRRDLRLKANV